VRKCGVEKAVGDAGIGRGDTELDDLRVIEKMGYGADIRIMIRASMISWLCYWLSRLRARSWIFSC